MVIPIFAGMVGSGSASVGLVSMSNTMASFAPIYGIGLAIGLLVMFFGLAAWLNLWFNTSSTMQAGSLKKLPNKPIPLFYLEIN